MIYLIFSKLLSRITRGITRIYIPTFLRPFVLGRFVKLFGVNESESEYPLTHYRSFNDFFTRNLNSTARIIDKTSLGAVSPVDAVIQEHGPITEGCLIQAKGVRFSLEELLPNRNTLPFEGGYFITFYLAPHDCHRIYSPVNGEITGWQHVPGALFPVREPHISKTTGLYVKNERLTSFISTEFGRVAVIKVGAFNVGTMSLAYDNTIETNHAFQSLTESSCTPPIAIKKGEHLGTFHLGSTVILIFEKGHFTPEISSTHIQIGQRIGTLK